MNHEGVHCDAKNKVLQENVGPAFFPPHPQPTSMTLHLTAIDSEGIYAQLSFYQRTLNQKLDDIKLRTKYNKRKEHKGKEMVIYVHFFA